MIVVAAALKGGVGKTTAAVYLAAVAASRRRPTTLVDADPQASAADWLESSDDRRLRRVDVVEAPTERLLAKALDRIASDGIVLVDTPPANERLLTKALNQATVVVLCTRVGGVETARAAAVMNLVPGGVPVGLVIGSARTFTRDYRKTLTAWTDGGIPVWGTIPERVALAAGPMKELAADGLDAYRNVWRRALRAARSA